MSEVLDKIREKYPQYKDVPDDDLAFGIGSKYPAYLQDSSFKSEYDRAVSSRTITGTTPPPVQLSAYEKLRLQGVGPGLSATTGPSNPEEIIPSYLALLAPSVQIPRIEAKSTLGQIAAAPVNVASGIVEQMTSPVGALTLPVLAESGLARAALGGVTAAQSVQQIRQAQNVGQVAEGVIGLGLSGTLLKSGAPETAKAMAETATEKGPSAIHEKAGEVLPDVRPQPVSGEGQVPAEGTGPETGARSAPTEEQKGQDVSDFDRYTQLMAQMKDALKAKDYQRFYELQKETEAIKNKNKGMPPKAPEAPPTVTETTPKAEPAPSPTAANARPAIRLVGGEVVTGEAGQTHPDIIASKGLKAEDIDQRGFVDDQGNFKDREQAAVETGLPTEREQDRLHSTDLPEAQAGVTTSTHQGMGGAVEGEFPAPRQATAAGATVEQGEPENRPIGAVSSLGQSLNNAFKSVMTFAKAAAGDTMPKTTAAHRETGEAGARYLSSRIAANPLADSFVVRALQDTEVDPVKFGAALTEDNLQSIRQSLKLAAEEERGKGNNEEADALDAKAQNVATIIGSKGSPFATEDEYLDYLGTPEVKKALGQHVQLWQEVIEPQYKQAREIDPDVELPSRGLNTGARINLKAVVEGEPVGKAVQGVGGPSLTATFKRRTPFGVKAKGTGQSYDINYQNIIRNTFGKQLEIANKNAFDDALVKSGNAEIGPPGQTVSIGGEATVPFPISRKVVVGPGFTASAAKNIYVKKSLAGEYRAAANVDPRMSIPIVTGTMNVLNKAALAGLTDGTVHVSNQMTALFNRPSSGRLLTDTLLSATGRADVPVTLIRTVMKAFQDNHQQMAELAEIGAQRPEGFGGGPMGKLLNKTDQLTRLMLDDVHKGLVKEGLVQDTETSRREYANQVGQYNRRAQGWLMRMLRDTGFGPFATAGRTFNALGVKMATLSPGAPATGPFAAAALRANVLSKWVGTAVLVGTLNYLLTKDKGGGVMGRPGTKLGSVDLGIDNKSGKHLALPLADLIGVGRGLRVTGARSAIDAKRLGLSNADAIDAASRDIINSAIAPAAGPPVRFGMVAATGYPPAVNVGKAAPTVPPGESQRLENVKEALRESSPVIGTYEKIKEGRPLDEILSTQFPRFAPYAGKTEAMAQDYPRIVQAAQANDFINYIVHETRRKDPDARLDFAIDQINRLPPEFQKKAWDELKHRRVFAQ